MPDVDSTMQDRGPVPGYVHVSLTSQETVADEGRVVTFGTAESTCKTCDDGEVVVGWSQGRLVEDKVASINLYSPQWKTLVADASDPISFGDVVSVVTNGTLIRTGNGNTGDGYAMNDAVAASYLLWIYNCCAVGTAATS